MGQGSLTGISQGRGGMDFWGQTLVPYGYTAKNMRCFSRMARKRQHFPRRLFAKQWSPERTERHRRSIESQKVKDHSRYESAKAVQQGVLEPRPCQHCGAIQNPDGTPIHKHHLDYDKPLEIKWLCRTCHINEHMRLKGKPPSRPVPFHPKPTASAEVKQAAEAYNKLLKEYRV
jgi:hypothetical protein